MVGVWRRRARLHVRVTAASGALSRREHQMQRKVSAPTNCVDVTLGKNGHWELNHQTPATVFRIKR